MSKFFLVYLFLQIRKTRSYFYPERLANLLSVTKITIVLIKLSFFNLSTERVEYLVSQCLEGESNAPETS